MLGVAVAMDMGIESMKQKAAGLLITLVNPRFAYFNRTERSKTAIAAMGCSSYNCL